MGKWTIPLETSFADHQSGYFDNSDTLLYALSDFPIQYSRFA